MIPYIELGPVSIPTYGIMSVIGGAAMVLVALWLFHYAKLDKNQILYTYVYGGIGAFLGAHVLFALTRVPQIIEFFKHISYFTSELPGIKGFVTLGNALGLLVGGMVFYGGLIGGLAGGMLSLKKCKVDTMHYADVFAPTVPMFHCFGRVGCFLSGCCYGAESSLGIVLYNTGNPALDGIRRFPVQLVEAAFELILSFVLILLYYRLGCKFTSKETGRKIKKGGLLAVYIILYGIARFLLEFLRGDLIRGIWFGLSTSQWISIVLVICSIVFLCVEDKTDSAASSGADARKKEENALNE